MSRFWEIAFCLPLLFRRHVCLSKLKHSPSRELPLTARKTVFSHLKRSQNARVFSKSRKVWKSPFLPPAAFENWQKWCIFVSLVLVNVITSSNVLLTFHSTSLALSKTLDYFWKAVKIVLFLAVLVTPLEALERLG